MADDLRLSVAVLPCEYGGSWSFPDEKTGELREGHTFIGMGGQFSLPRGVDVGNLQKGDDCLVEVDVRLAKSGLRILKGRVLGQ